VVPECLVEAAELQARGEEVEACKRLETGIKRGSALGADEDRVWLALFQQLQLLGRQTAFETLSLVYARRFEKSPPAWVPPAIEASAASTGSTGLALGLAFNAQVGDALKQLMAQAQTQDQVVLDVSAVADADNAGCTLAMRALAALKKARKSCLFVGAAQLATVLAKKLAVGQNTNEPMWLLMLELYQQAGDQALFEDAAVNYAVTFEVSPPSFEAAKVSAQPKLVLPVVPAVAVDGLVWRGRLLGDQSSLCAALTKAEGANEITIDAAGLIRIDAVAATHLKSVLQTLSNSGAAISILGLGHLLAVFLDNQGWGDIVRLQTRKA
jgi:anti-anti-sigma regulatory factor